MEYSRFLGCLAADFARLLAVVPADLAAAVPSCPGWTVADLTRHVGEVSRRPSRPGQPTRAHTGPPPGPDSKAIAIDSETIQTNPA